MKLSQEPIMKESGPNYAVVPLMENEEPVRPPKIHTCAGKTFYCPLIIVCLLFNAS